MQKKAVTWQRNNEYAQMQEDYSIIKVTHIGNRGWLVILRLDWIGVWRTVMMDEDLVDPKGWVIMIAKIREGGHLEEGERGYCPVGAKMGFKYNSEEVVK